ncbi:MAG: acetate/propionate family kinase [Planctomycetes bacterium]|nr:acetate/propionate family kinase [Planctomycetota bacterium]
MSRAARHILSINGGSSSLKFSLFEAGTSIRRILDGAISRIGLPDARLVMHGDVELEASVNMPDHVAAVHELIDRLDALGATADLAAVGHRIVHGGPTYWRPQLVDAAMLDELRRLSPFDPVHLPQEIALIEAMGHRLDGVGQVACFDTAFFYDLPRVSRMLPIPRRYEAMGIRRYGFHGLSYAYLMDELGEAATGRVVLAHLGNGASLAAVRDGKPIDTTMGFTPTAGTMMSTRSGDIDPGLVAYLAHAEGMTADQFNDMVNHASGLLGVSETSSDMRDLLSREAGDERAAEAVTMFCYQVRRWIGAFAAALGGLDTLVFTGGIGEHQPVIRSRICADLAFAGVALDASRNATNDTLISAAASKVAVRVVPTDEALLIARLVNGLLDEIAAQGKK